MTTRLDHKRGSTLRWHCLRTTDPKPGSGEQPQPISLTGVSVACSLRDDVRDFHRSLSISFSGVNRAGGEFLVYAAASEQDDWPLGDVFFDFTFTSESPFAGQDADVDKTETAVMNIHK